MLHQELSQLAWEIICPTDREPAQGEIRRSISTTYYSLFHLLAYEVKQQLCDNNPKHDLLRETVVRSLEHGSMKRLCQEFTKSQPRNILLKELWREYQIRPDSHIGQFAKRFISLQELRHLADYDTSRNIIKDEALDAYLDYQEAIINWQNMKQEQPHMKTLFLTLLPLWPTLSKR